MAVKVNINTQAISEAMADYINQNAQDIAKQIGKDVRKFAQQHKVTGNYAKGIRVRKSKFEDGGYIVLATSPHSALVEFGTRGRRYPKKADFLYDKETGTYFGESVAPMPALSPMRNALAKNIEYARQKFMTMELKSARDMWE